MSYKVNGKLVYIELCARTLAMGRQWVISKVYTLSSPSILLLTMDCCRKIDNDFFLRLITSSLIRQQHKTATTPSSITMRNKTTAKTADRIMAEDTFSDSCSIRYTK